MRERYRTEAEYEARIAALMDAGINQKTGLSAYQERRVAAEKAAQREAKRAKRRARLRFWER
jgi:hypothetical protein